MRSEPLLITSSSAVQTFGECPKKYQLSYEMLLEPTIRSEPMDKGTSLHKMLEAYWKWVRWNGAGRPDPAVPTPVVNDDDEMAPVFAAYLENKAIADQANMKEILLVEEPLFVEIVSGVMLRVTPDLVYRDMNDWIVGRDNKSFKNWSNWDMELDYQGRLYTAYLSLAFPGENIRFEWEKIRQTPPGVVHNAKGEKWTPSECYDRVDLIINQREIDTVIGETQAKVRRILGARFDYANGDKYAFNRQEAGWKTGIGSCAQCLYRQLCKLDMQGTLDDQAIALHATKRKPLSYEESQVIK